MSGYTRADEPERTHPYFHEWLARRVLAGYSAKAIVAASGGAFSERTAYRWKRDLVRLETVCLGGFEATFAIRRSHPPTRLSSWRRLSTARPQRFVEIVDRALASLGSGA